MVAQSTKSLITKKKTRKGTVSVRGDDPAHRERLKKLSVKGTQASLDTHLPTGKGASTASYKRRMALARQGFSYEDPLNSILNGAVPAHHWKRYLKTPPETVSETKALEAEYDHEMITRFETKDLALIGELKPVSDPEALGKSLLEGKKWPPAMLASQRDAYIVEMEKAKLNRDPLLFDLLKNSLDMFELVNSCLKPVSGTEEKEIDMDVVRKKVSQKPVSELIDSKGNTLKPVSEYVSTAVSAETVSDGFDDSHGIDVIDAATGQRTKNPFPVEPAERIRVMNKMKLVSAMTDSELRRNAVNASPETVSALESKSGHLRAGFHDGKIFNNIYAYEYALRTMHRMIMRKVPIDQIAKAMGMSVANAARLRTELHRRMSEEMRYTDVYSLLGDTNAFYLEMRAQGLKMLDRAKDIPEQAMAASVAFKAEADRIKALDTARVFETSPVKLAKASENDRHDAKSLIDVLKGILGDEKPQEMIEETAEKPQLF